VSPTAASAAGAARMADLTAERHVVVCCGSGGVGKTTTAAVVALEAARLGRRAAVVTIDPAKRLADALGLEGLTNEPSRIEGPWPGELWALMLDTERTFNDLVATYAGSHEQAEKILANRFYRNIAGALSGTQEYMASEKLFELANDDRFDLVVVDTPPSRNALDFLEAPGRLTRFLEHRLYRLVTAPTRGIVRAVNVAAQSFLRGVAKVVGGEVIADALAFFAAFDGMEEGFSARAQMVDELLRDNSTAFVLVASPKRETVDEATFFADKLAEHDIAVQAVVVNRIHPLPGSPDPEGDRARAAELAGSTLGDLYRCLSELEDVAVAERTHLGELRERAAGAPMVEIPYLPFEVHDLVTLDALGDHLYGRAEPT